MQQIIWNCNTAEVGKKCQIFRVIHHQMSINMAWAALKSAVGAAPVAAAAATQVAAEQVAWTLYKATFLALVCGLCCDPVLIPLCWDFFTQNCAVESQPIIKVSVAVRSLATVKPHVPLIKVIFWQIDALK